MGFTTPHLLPAGWPCHTQEWAGDVRPPTSRGAGWLEPPKTWRWRAQTAGGGHVGGLDRAAAGVGSCPPAPRTLSGAFHCAPASPSDASPESCALSEASGVCRGAMTSRGRCAGPVPACTTAHTARCLHCAPPKDRPHPTHIRSHPCTSAPSSGVSHTRDLLHGRAHARTQDRRLPAAPTSGGGCGRTTPTAPTAASPGRPRPAPAACTEMKRQSAVQALTDRLDRSAAHDGWDVRVRPWQRPRPLCAGVGRLGRSRTGQPCVLGHTVQQ